MTMRGGPSSTLIPGAGAGSRGPSGLGSFSRSADGAGAAPRVGVLSATASYSAVVVWALAPMAPVVVLAWVVPSVVHPDYDRFMHHEDHFFASHWAVSKWGFSGETLFCYNPEQAGLVAGDSDDRN